MLAGKDMSVVKLVATPMQSGKQVNLRVPKAKKTAEQKKAGIRRPEGVSDVVVSHLDRGIHVPAFRWLP